ncbi:hypothetical protein [Pedobacter metabolipauper]|uniref:Uncharacterized protein n=1 Tax=Pedobacter metabolipauper TaxID=425513 RepID=A0A4R6T1L8_9SPHI|nr:hypothetical protein [Pedobacter metabolipauper]TDQ11380.1 hypothetical protein ATK78_0498 [Pedobacter metabolipauper]
MKKKRTYIIVFILLFIIYMLGFKSINYSISSMLLPGKLDSYPYLNEGVSSEHYEIKFLYTGLSNIDFDTKSMNTIVETAHVNDETLGYYKYNNQGELLDSFRTDSSFVTNFYPGGTLFGKDYYVEWAINGDKTKKPFAGFLNMDFKMDAAVWDENFQKFYAAADFVHYYPSENWHYLTFYFRINGTWTALNTLENDDRIYQDMSSENKLDFKNFKQKGNQFVPLKSSITDKYPLLSYKHNNNYEGIKYNWEGSKEPITLNYFKKEFIAGEAAYTNIPLSWGGTGYFTLKYKNELLNFKEVGAKDIGFFKKAEFHINLYTTPQPWFNKTELAFINVSYTSSLVDRGGEGLYVIKRKR